jgi:hypothetical protein
VSSNRKDAHPYDVGQRIECVYDAAAQFDALPTSISSLN